MFLSYIDTTIDLDIYQCFASLRLTLQLLNEQSDNIFNLAKPLPSSTYSELAPCINHGLINKDFCISFIHSGYFYSASSSPLPLRGAPDTARILCRSFTPKVPTWRLERDSNP